MSKTQSITGAEYRKFYLDNDTKFWPEGSYVEDVVVEVNGKDLEDFDPESRVEMPDEAIVKIKGGYVLFEDAKYVSLAAHFRRWRKAQTSTTVAVEIPTEHLDALHAWLKGVGGQVI